VGEASGNKGEGRGRDVMTGVVGVVGAFCDLRMISRNPFSLPVCV
jgi:hypothetical protein